MFPFSFEYGVDTNVHKTEVRCYAQLVDLNCQGWSNCPNQIKKIAGSSSHDGGRAFETLICSAVLFIMPVHHLIKCKNITWKQYT